MKPFWKSKMVMANAGLFVSYVLAWEPLTTMVNPEVLAMVTAIVNIILRFVTDKPVKFK